MKPRTHVFVLLLCLAALAVSGCRRNIVLASPPSVASPPPAASSESGNSETTEPAPAVRPAPSRPRPAPAETEPPKPKAEPESEPQPPQISPVLTDAQLADAQRRTTDDLLVAERTVQLASTKQLNASQNDLYEKIKGFDKDAHDAISANDWDRAQNLAQKARVLSDELDKSL